MALNETRTWLIAYDIADPRRLGRVHRYLKTEAVPVQYSVFVTRATAARVGVIRATLADLIDPGADDVRIYQVPEHPEVACFGTRALPEGIQLLEGRVSSVVPPFAGSVSDCRGNGDREPVFGRRSTPGTTPGPQS
jgi:CRISPR-associated protein Cas2